MTKEKFVVVLPQLIPNTKGINEFDKRPMFILEEDFPIIVNGDECHSKGFKYDNTSTPFRIQNISLLITLIMQQQLCSMTCFMQGNL